MKWEMLCTTLLLLLVTGCHAKVTKTPPPEGWTAYPTPAEDGEAMECANHSSNEWHVSLENGAVKIDLYDEGIHEEALPFDIVPKDAKAGLAGDRHVLKLHDGWLVGFNAGEFGGALWWFSENGDQRIKLSDENVVGFSETASGIFVFVGLAHLLSDNGKMLFIQKDQTSPPKIQVTADLGSEPAAFSIESPDSVLLLTTKGLFRVWSSGKFKKLKETHYTFLYPNSMVILPSGQLYVGMRHFITRLTPMNNGYMEEWFVPKDCVQFKLKDGRCICEGS